jgi:hypothetical protein
MKEMKTKDEHIGNAPCRALFLLILLVLPVHAHDLKRRNRKPTKAALAIKQARQQLDAAKKKTAHECCAKPACDACALHKGGCACGVQVRAGQGACGECVESWQAGFGNIKQVKNVVLLPTVTLTDEEKLARVTELVLARNTLNEAKRVLASEGRFNCCTRGGCGSCALAGDCQCGTALVRQSGGVCGECLDGWHAGRGAFAGISPDEVKLAALEPAALTAMSQQGSGTSWQPATSPVNGWRGRAGAWSSWSWMAHGQLFISANHQAKPRGVTKAESQNWLMLMAQRQAGRGALQVRGMFSAEALTLPHGGAPQLFQTGETYRRRPIIDAQHPHDAVMELAASYALPLGESTSLEVYGGPVGEPALGPVAYMHRASARENPASPISHHLMDSTHITHGVVTLGLKARWFKFEASAFRGREPDEDRLRVELGRLDSFSGRVWFAPTENWAAQVSYGRLQNPEVYHPGSLKRWTASLAYNRAFAQGYWATTAVWGRNREYDPTFGESYLANAYLLESNLDLFERHHVYTRLELADKQGLLASNIFRRPGLATEPSLGKSVSGEFLLTRLLHPDPNEIDPIIFTLQRRVGAFTFGGVRDVMVQKHWRLGVGADVTFYHARGLVAGIYGERPVSYRIFLRLRPNGLR